MAFAILLTGFLLAVMYYDLTKFVIPNWLNGVLALIYLVMVIVSPEEIAWGWALLTALGAFAIGFAIFIFKIMGGGDIKLLTVCALWVGPQHILDFVMAVAIYGGLLSVFLLIMRPTTAWIFSRLKNPPKTPKVLVIGEPLPYGLAIAGGMLTLLWLGWIPGVMIDYR